MSKHSVTIEGACLYIPVTATVSSVSAADHHEALLRSEETLHDLETIAEKANYDISGALGIAHADAVAAYCVEGEDGTTRFFDLRYKQITMVEFLRRFAGCTEIAGRGPLAPR